jgi:hypothetical protein
MVGEQSLDGLDDQVTHRLGALAARLGLGAVEQARVVQ